MNRFLRAGAVAGAVGGLTLALFLLVVGERTIDDAVALEGANTSHDHDVVDLPFTRGEQKVGGAVGAIVVGTAFGAVFGIVFAALRHRLPGRDDWQRAWWLGGAAWLSVHLVPALKYPPNPPGVGSGDTVADRTVQFVLFVGVSVGALALAWRAAGALRSRLGDHVRLPVAAVAWLAVVAAALIAFPGSPDAVAAPADLVWRFRIESLSGSFLGWAATASVFGVIVGRDRARRSEALSATR